MPFVPRTFEQILEDMIAFVQANTIVSDFTVGSVARTILEAAALEDDEQYFQMVQLLDAFRITTARGEDLDRRLADFGIVRREATTATSRIRFFDANLITEQLAQDELTSAVTITVFNSSVFPTSGFPYIVRIAEGTVRVQDLSVTANNTTTNVLTVSTALANDMVVGDRVSLVTGASSHTINTGTSVQAPPTVSEAPRIYSTQEPGFIAAGNFFSNEVIIKSQQGGTKGNVGANRITQFVGGAPFSGAGVINLVAAFGGQNRESDFEFRQRAIDQLQALSRGTPLAIRTASIGVTDVNTGQTSVSASIIEDFVNDEVIVYIDDGTGLVPDVVALASDVIDTGGGALTIGASTVPLSDSSAFPSSGSILIDEDGSSNAPELLEYISKDDSTDILTLSGTTTIEHDDAASVLFVDVVSTGAETGQRRFKLQNPPVIRGTDRIFVDPGTGWVEQTPDTSYILNRGNGEFQVVDLSGLVLGSEVVAHYSYYTNLIRTVQRVLEGDIDSSTAYPGVKAAGIFLSVEAPVLRRITVVAAIVADVGFVESDLAPLVQEQIESYINSLKIGEDVIQSKLTDVAFNVRGVKDVFITLPTSNVTILENELPVPFASDGTTIVTIL
jgi:uncharacterized phage protein gp47/JayE